MCIRDRVVGVALLVLRQMFPSFTAASSSEVNMCLATVCALLRLPSTEDSVSYNELVLNRWLNCLEFY